MKNRLLHIFFLALAALFCLCSCGLEEPIDTPQTSDGYIEFVARQTRYSNVDVDTKSGSDQIEDVIHNLYFLLFENSTNSGRLIKYEKLSPSNLSVSLKTDKGLTSAYACFLANVNEDFVTGITTVGGLNSAIYNIEKYVTSGNRLGVPVVKINGADVPCLPMFGPAAASIDMSTATGNPLQITLRRLFAKITLNLSVNIPGDNPPAFTLNRVSLTNLPTNVALTTPSTDSPWVSFDNVVTSNEISTRYFVNPVSLNLSQTLSNGSTSPYTVTCYVPEYIVTAEKTASQLTDYDSAQPAQIYKPLLCPNKRPTYINLEGTMSNSVYTYNIYLGENNESRFSLLRNTQYINNVTITGTESKDVDNRVTYTSMPTILVNGESANCYIITSAGKYQLDTYRGVNKTLSPSALLEGKPRQVWSDIGDITFHNANTVDSRIIFEITEEQFKAGNAVIALVDDETADDEILWSWHLWFCKADDPRDNLDRYPNDSDQLVAHVMNRNLGAKEALGMEQIFDNSISSALNSAINGFLDGFLWRDGLYYQWGRKDPLRSTGNSNSDASVDYATSYKNPSTFYSKWDATGAGWSGSSKSTDDPCPQGYRVPSKSIWKSNNSDAEGIKIGVQIQTTTTTAYTYNLHLTSGDSNPSPFIFYPYASYIDSSTGSLYDSKNVPDYMITDVKDIDIKLATYEYYLEYEAIVNSYTGAIWVADARIDYEFKDIKKKSDGDLIYWSRSKTILSNWSKWSSQEISKISNKTLREAANSLASSIVDESEFIYNRDGTISASNALPVRCVKE